MLAETFSQPFFSIIALKLLSVLLPLNFKLLRSGLSQGFNKILSKWQQLWNRWRRKKLVAKVRVSGKFLKPGPLRVHFQHSVAKIRVSEQNRDIIKFWLFYSVTAHEYSIQTGVISREKQAVSSPEIAGEFHWPLALIENPVLLSFKAAIANEDSPARYMSNCSLLLTDVECLFFITDVLWNWTLMVFGVFCQQASPRISRYI